MIFGTGNNLTPLTINFILQSIQASVLIPDLELSKKFCIKKYLIPPTSRKFSLADKAPRSRSPARWPDCVPNTAVTCVAVLRDKTVGNPSRVRFQADRREQRYYDGSSRELHTLLLYSSTELELPGETGLRRML